MKILTKIHHFFLILFFLFLQTQIYAQDSTKKLRVNYVKDLYTYYKSRIKKKKYYLNEYKINASALQWQNKSNLQKVERYYYSYTGDAKPILRLIIITLESGSKKLKKEFVFDENEHLALCIDSHTNPDKKSPYKKRSAYFDGQAELTAIFHDKTYIPYTSVEQNEGLAELQEESRELYQKFNRHFLEIEMKNGGGEDNED